MAGQYRKFESMGPYDPIPSASQAAIESAETLYNDIKNGVPDLVTTFDSKWTAWTQTWGNSLSSSASDHCLIPEFDELADCGPKIIPLVVYKLSSEPKNFFGVQLYNELEEDKNYLVDPKDVLNYNVLQRQANLIVDMNYDRNQVVQGRIQAWKMHCTRCPQPADLSALTKSDDYSLLCELGGSIISHIMLAYSKDQNGYWFVLLHEIVHGLGERTDSRTVDFKQQYAAWSKWYQSANHSEVP